MWELDYEESWALKNWCFWTVVLEKTLESPLDCKEIQPVHSKGDQQLEKEEMKNLRVSRRKEILKIRAEINAKETK